MRQDLIEEYVQQRRACLPTLNVDVMTWQEHRYAMGVIEDDGQTASIEDHAAPSRIESEQETSDMRQELISEALDALRDRCWHLVPWDKLTPKEIEYVHSSMEDE